MTDLTDRMRTCAAHIVSMTGVKEGSDPDANQTLPLRLVADAADLLIEASNTLEPMIETAQTAVAAQLNTPMEIIPPTEVEAERMRRGLPPREKPPLGEWHDPQTLGDAVRKLAQQETLTLPPDAPQDGKFTTSNPRACPRCDSRAAKRVRREGRQLMLSCPVCATSWQWKPKAEWI